MATEAQGRIAVIGAGMAGTAAAYKLRAQGYDVTLFESRDRVGGRIWTVKKGDFLMDLGTAVYLGTYHDAIRLIDEVGLTDELCERPAMGAMPRGDKLHYFNYSTPVRTALTTRAISWPSKLKAIKLALLTFQSRKSLGYYDYDQLAELDIETVQRYCRRALNEELLQYCGRPLVSGTWVADDQDTSIALLLWTIRNMLVPSVYNLDSGVVGLPRELAKHVDTRLSSPVSNVTDTGTGVEVTFSPDGGDEQTESFDGVVIATTAEPALAMYDGMDDLTRELYETCRYRKLGSICMGLSKRPKDPATYFLVPPCEDPDVIAVIADHIKARNRAPEGKGLITMLLSHEYLERNEHLTDDEVLDYAFARAQRYHSDIARSDLEEHMVVRWNESVPVLDAGRFALIKRYKEHLPSVDRVQMAGDLDRIPGLNGALVSGLDAAGRLSEALAAKAPAQLAAV